MRNAQRQPQKARSSSSGMSKRGSLIFLVALLAVLLPMLLQIVYPFLTAFILAVILAIVIHPANRQVCRRIPRAGLATLLTTLATVVLLGVVIFLVGAALTHELTTTYEALSQRSLEEGGWPALVTHAADRIVDTLATRLPLNKAAIRAELLDGITTATGYMRNSLLGAIGGVTSVLITGLLTTLFLFYLLQHGERWMRRLASFTPLDSRVTESLFQTVRLSVIANVSGVFAVVLAQGLLLGTGFWFLGLRSPVLWGAIGGLASIVPVVGSPMVWTPVVVAFVLMGSYWKALVLALWGAFVVGSVDDILRPFVVGAREKQPPVLIALAAIGGTCAFGVLGILLGPLVVSLVAALLKEIQELVSPPVPGVESPPPS
jgi:predicted PurR-regulated permease PerM